MLTLSYNHNQNGFESIIVSQESKLLDISIIKNSQYNSKINRFKRAVNSFSKFIEKYGSDNKVLIYYPPNLKGDKEKQIIQKNIDNKYNIKLNKSPFKICSSINYFISKNKLNGISYDNISEPIKVYTDASIQENKDPTISYALLNSEDEILSLHAQKLGKNKDIYYYELMAGFAGLMQSKHYNFNNITWISDNQPVQNILSKSSNNRSIATKQIRSDFKNISSQFRIFNYKDISGSKNRLADSLASDVRKNNFENRILYESPAIEKRKS